MLIGLGIGLPFASAISLAAQIAALFAAGEQGAWYDPSDWSTLFQDSAGTLPVTAVGQPVGKMLDKSGRGNHATQPTAINRPVVQQDGTGKYYLAFNGTNSWMSTGSIDFTATDKMTVVAGVRKLSDAAESIVFELSANTFLNSGAFNLMAPGGLSVARDSAYVLSAGGSFTTANGPAAALYAAPTTGVITELLSISLDTAILRVNGAQASSSVTDQGTGNFGNYPLYIGARAGSSLFFNGNIYELIVRGALSSDSQIVASEKFVNTKTGAY